ncbi:rhomboid-domain-containing protein [Nemania sp. FL0916]|nr:rhomboid-domain-containing protein [Nemania sp. FL0916]
MFFSKTAMMYLRHGIKIPPRVPLLRPVLWSAAACSGIYLSLAAYDAYSDARRARANAQSRGHKKPIRTLEETERFGRSSVFGPNSTRTSVTDIIAAAQQRATGGVMAITAFVAALGLINPASTTFLAHSTISGANHTLLTSVFVHSGLVHLAVNMYGMYAIIPPAVVSPTFRADVPHFFAFFLSSGILSSLALHASAVWPGRTPYIMGCGASGALYAALGVVGVANPDARIGLLFIPGSLPMRDALVCSAIFDAVGIFVRYPFFNLAHAAHLGGLLLGIAYAQYGGNKEIWQRARKLSFKAMRLVGLV